MFGITPAIVVALSLFTITSTALPASTNSTTPDLVSRGEAVSCYGSGVTVFRAPLIDAIGKFCNAVIGRHFGPNADSYTDSYPIDFSHSVGFQPININIELKSVNGCQFIADGNCGRLLRRPVDECNTNGEVCISFCTMEVLY
ncbi:hypothetical protein C8J56DRAFT_964160 [Mycena floridula]|nr:hypothetical protein C8J56DRAFT_964159 [Mycena floridula]KAJ7579422.1 hypothetical protein C8J56DRAFT_964160 [Mycena floridula]